MATMPSPQEDSPVKGDTISVVCPQCSAHLTGPLRATVRVGRCPCGCPVVLAPRPFPQPHRDDEAWPVRNDPGTGGARARVG